jgi:predicted nucleotidyltransferase
MDQEPKEDHRRREERVPSVRFYPLEALLHRKVDLVLARSLSPHFRPYIEADATPL